MNDDNAKPPFSELELEKASNLVANLLESNWHGIQKAVHESSEGKLSVSVSLKLNHYSVNAHNIKANISYAVKTADEAECIVQRDEEAEEK
jgi:hypothetical protein